MIKNVLTIILACLTITSCSTIFRGTSQKINVSIIDADTKFPIKQVDCTISNQYMHNFLMTNPATIDVKKSMKQINVVCSKNGYKDKQDLMSPHLDWVSLINTIHPLNMIYWTPFSLLNPVGWGIDIATGAWMRYPSTVVIEMQKVETKQKTKRK